MIFEQGSDTYGVMPAIAIKKDGKPAYYDAGGKKMMIKVVFRSGADAPDWTTFKQIGEDYDVQNWWFIDPNNPSLTINAGEDPGERWWMLCEVTLTGDDSSSIQFQWDGIHFSIVVAYLDSDPTPSLNNFRDLLEPTRVIYLVDASGSMADEIQQISDLQLDAILAWAGPPDPPPDWFSVVVLKGGLLRAFPSSEWNPAAPPDPEAILTVAKGYATEGSGNSPLGALVALAQEFLDDGHFTDPLNLGNGALILVTDGRENGSSTPKIRIPDGADVEDNTLRRWSRRYGYRFVVVHYDALPGEIWDPWTAGAGVIEDIDL